MVPEENFTVLEEYYGLRHTLPTPRSKETSYNIGERGPTQLLYVVTFGEGCGGSAVFGLQWQRFFLKR